MFPPHAKRMYQIPRERLGIIFNPNKFYMPSIVIARWIRINFSKARTTLLWHSYIVVTQLVYMEYITSFLYMCIPRFSLKTRLIVACVPSTTYSFVRLNFSCTCHFNTLLCKPVILNSNLNCVLFLNLFLLEYQRIVFVSISFWLTIYTLTAFSSNVQ